jgi:glutamyl-tRNA synthetase
MKTRLAPTPSGFLHAGNGASFVLAWKLAREAGGRVLLRIDDLDAERARPEYVQDIFDTLRWLGVDWDEGPRNAVELAGQWSQHLRMGGYLELVDELRTGGHLYACSCSRKDIAARGAAREYDGHCRDRNLPLDLPGSRWRLRLPSGRRVAMHTWPDGALRELPLDMPDPVIRQQNGRPAYQVASLADDVRFGVDLVVRGTDLLPSTAIQLYLAELLGKRVFKEVRFVLHPLLLGAAGAKLSKSLGAEALITLRQAGESPGPVLRLAEEWLRQVAGGGA